VEGVNDLRVLFELSLVPVEVFLQFLASASIQVRRNRTYRQDVCVESIKVDEQVNPSICESRHTTVMVGRGVDMVHAESVGTKLAHELNIALALLGVDEGVIRTKLVRNACGMQR